MTPEDHRHGKLAGYDRHRRDGEDACDPCKRAAALYENERRLEQMAGGRRTVSDTGTARRVQALVALGYTFRQIGAALGLSHDVARKWAWGQSYIRTTTAAKVAVLYEEWSMKLPEASQGAAYARTTARRAGWAPPLAWDDIDDENERPMGVRDPKRTLPTTEHRFDVLRDLADRRAGISEACRVLEVNRDALERWCERHEMRDIYEGLLAQEYVPQAFRNGYTVERSA